MLGIPSSLLPVGHKVKKKEKKSTQSTDAVPANPKDERVGGCICVQSFKLLASTGTNSPPDLASSYYSKTLLKFTMTTCAELLPFFYPSLCNVPHNSCLPSFWLSTCQKSHFHGDWRGHMRYWWQLLCVSTQKVNRDIMKRPQTEE